MPVQTRSMIKRAEEQRLEQQREFREIQELSREPNEDDDDFSIQQIDRDIITHKIDNGKLLNALDIEFFKSQTNEIKNIFLKYVQNAFDLSLNLLIELRKNHKINTKEITKTIIRIFRLTENLLRMLNATGQNKDAKEGNVLKLTSLGKIRTLKCKLEEEHNFTSEQKTMMENEFNRYSESVVNLFE